MLRGSPALWNHYVINTAIADDRELRSCTQESVYRFMFIAGIVRLNHTLINIIIFSAHPICVIQETLRGDLRLCLLTICFVILFLNISFSVLKCSWEIAVVLLYDKRPFFRFILYRSKIKLHDNLLESLPGPFRQGPTHLYSSL